MRSHSRRIAALDRFVEVKSRSPSTTASMCRTRAVPTPRRRILESTTSRARNGRTNSERFRRTRCRLATRSAGLGTAHGPDTVDGAIKGGDDTDASPLRARHQVGVGEVESATAARRRPEGSEWPGWLGRGVAGEVSDKRVGVDERRHRRVSSRGPHQWSCQNRPDGLRCPPGGTRRRLVSLVGFVLRGCRRSRSSSIGSDPPYEAVGIRAGAALAF